jgi:hypothetical protein
MNYSLVDTGPIIEKFMRSRFWREYQPFRVNDFASFCNCSRYEAVCAIREMGIDCDHAKVYKRSNRHPLAHTQWRKPLKWDGEHTPKFC